MMICDRTLKARVVAQRDEGVEVGPRHEPGRDHGLAQRTRMRARTFSKAQEPSVAATTGGPGLGRFAPALGLAQLAQGPLALVS
jgi:hypothetical protein